MKALFIWNSISKDYIISHLKRVNQFQSNGDSARFITSLQEYNELSQELFERTKKGTKQKEKESYQRIYILPELNWGNDMFFGYKIALEILEKWKNPTPPYIAFISLIERKKLHDLVSGKYQYLVKTFDHTDLLKLGKNPLPVKNISQSKWRFFKNYALTKSGILDDIAHKLTGILNPENSENALKNILDQIKSQRDLVGNDVYVLANQEIDTIEDKPAFIKELTAAIEEKIREYKPHNRQDIVIPTFVKIMVIEDNEDHLQIIKKSLERYFESDKTLFCFTDGETALNELKTNPDDYNLVLVDLELLSDGFYQNIQGIDILDYLKSQPKVSYRIITGLGRKGVREMLQIDSSLILSKKQLYHFDTDEEVDKMLLQMVADFKEKEKVFHMNFGPVKGIFSWGGFKTTLSNYYLKNKDKYWKEAFEILEKFKENELNAGFWDKSLPSGKRKDSADIDKELFSIDDSIRDSKKERFSGLLAQRLIIFYLSSKSNFKIILDNTADEYGSYFETLNNNDIKLHYNYIQKIGIVTEKVEKKQEYKVLSEGLFPPEIVFMESLKQEIIENYQPDILIKDNSQDIYELITTYFDLEETEAEMIGVPVDIDEWTYSDLKTCWQTMYEDVISKGNDSDWYHTLEAFVESSNLTQTIETQLSVHLPDIEKQIRKFNEIP